MSDTPTSTLPGDPSLTPAEPRTFALSRRLAQITLGTDFEEERFVLILSIFIGVFSGLAVVCFRVAIDWSRIALLGPLPHPSALRIIGAPTAVRLLVAILVIHCFPAVRASGVNQTKAALYIFNGYIPFKNAVGKFICSALAIGSGQSLGPEDPSLQIGASLASALVSNSRVRNSGCSLPSVPPPDSPPPSTPRSRLFCLSLRRSSDAGAPAFSARSCSQ